MAIIQAFKDFFAAQTYRVPTAGDRALVLGADGKTYRTDPAASPSAATVSNTPAGGIVATTVQGAIDELDTEKVTKAGDTMTGVLVVNQSGGSTFPAALTGTGLRFIQADSTQAAVTIDGSAGVPVLIFRTQGGTWASPSALTSSQNMGGVQAFGHDGTNAGTSVRATFRFQAAEAWTTTANGTRFDLRLTPTGSTTIATRLSAEANGDITPGSDNTQALGTVALRWNSLRVGTGTSSFAGNTTVGAATGPALFNVVGGRSTFQANSEPYSIGLRHAAGTGYAYLGASNSATPDLILSNNSGAELARLNNGGNLLLGTTTDNARLGIQCPAGTNGIVVTDGTYGTNVLRFNATFGVEFGNVDASPLHLITNNSQRVSITSAGLVGIAATTPTSPFQIASAASRVTPASGYIITSYGGGNSYWLLNANTNFNSGIHFGDPSADNVGRVEYAHNGDFMTFWTNAAERVRIASDGKVGINTTTAASMLDVNGDVAFRTGSVALANGLNSNISTPAFANIRITGPTGAFAVGGLTGGVDGRIVRLYNTVSQTMTIENENGSSTAGNRITTLTGANIVLRATARSYVSLRYDATESRWIVEAIN